MSKGIGWTYTIAVLQCPPSARAWSQPPRSMFAPPIQSSTRQQRSEICIRKVGSRIRWARIAEVPPDVITAFVRGKDVSFNQMVALANAANVPPSWLLFGEAEAEYPQLGSLASA